MNPDLHLHHLRIDDICGRASAPSGWSGRRSTTASSSTPAGGGRRAQPGVKGGITGGGIFAIWMSDCEIFDNRFTRTQTRPGGRVLRHQGPAGKALPRPSQHHRDELLDGVPLRERRGHTRSTTTSATARSRSPSTPAGRSPQSGRTFHIHHNWMKDSYSIEFVRNGVEIDHNLFDFDPAKDHGNLISGFGNAAAKGPRQLPQQPGEQPRPRRDLDQRGVQPTSRCATTTSSPARTATPRNEGLFGFNGEVRLQDDSASRTT